MRFKLHGILKFLIKFSIVDRRYGFCSTLNCNITKKDQIGKTLRPFMRRFSIFFFFFFCKGAMNPGIFPDQGLLCVSVYSSPPPPPPLRSRRLSCRRRRRLLPFLLSLVAPHIANFFDLAQVQKKYCVSPM